MSRFENRPPSVTNQDDDAAVAAYLSLANGPLTPHQVAEHLEWEHIRALRSLRRLLDRGAVGKKRTSSVIRTMRGEMKRRFHDAFYAKKE